MNKKRWISLALVGVMALSLTACKSDKGTESKTPDNSAAASQGATTSDWGVTRPEGLPEGYPTKEITWINCFSAGGAMETCIRIMGQIIRDNEGWDKSIVVNNIEGANGAIGWQTGVDADPDGYTTFFYPTAGVITSMAVDGTFMPDNLKMVCTLMADPGIIGVKADSPYETLEDLVNAAKENPGKISMGCTSVNGSEGLAIIQLEAASGCDFNAVPFDGETAVLTGVAGGHCDAFCLNVGDCRTFLEEGSIKALATGGEERSEFLPDVPTYQESGYDVVQLNVRGIAAPKDTDDAIIQYLSDCFEAASKTDEYLDQTKDMNIPYDFRNCGDAAELFAGFQTSYEELWQTNPWG